MRWYRYPTKKGAAAHYAREFEISELTAQVLLNRGFNGLQMMQSFLEPEFDRLHDPFLMKNMESAVRRIRRAIVRGERIHIHGDYDVDGISATSVLMSALRHYGAEVDYHIINRSDATVGLSVKSLKRDHLPKSPSLIITADCGTSSLEGIAYAKEHGTDVIVVDHHVPGPRLPKCAALLNPMQRGCPFPFKNLAAVGVAYTLVTALETFIQKHDSKWPPLDLMAMTDLVALGTIADLVPLSGPNRVYVRHGLELIEKARRPGLCALMREAGMLNSTSSRRRETVTARTIGFRLAPLLNAAGRMNDANKCVELLITNEYRQADSIAKVLSQANSERQQCERDVLKEAFERAQALDESGAPVLLLADRNWHPGVLGIVASRLVERFHRPAIVTAIDGSGMAKGSVRSPEGLDMLDALNRCRSLLDTWGGHKVAAGVAFKNEHFEELNERMCEAVRQQIPSGEKLERSLQVDAVVALEHLNPKVLHELTSLAPFGAGNPEPVLELRSVSPVQAKAVSGGNVRLRLRQGSRTLDAFGFGLGSRLDDLRRSVNLVVSPRMVRTNRGASIELVVKDFVLASEES